MSFLNASGVGFDHVVRATGRDTQPSGRRAACDQYQRWNHPTSYERVKEARKRGPRTVGFTGESGGALSGGGDVAVVVPSDDRQHIHETHFALGHALYSHDLPRA